MRSSGGGEVAREPGAAPTPPPHPPARPVAEVLSPMARVNQADPTKKGGRWAPEFVWNTDWAGALDAAEEARVNAKRPRAAPTPPPPPPGMPAPSAGLSFSRVADLNDMSVDLSEALRPRKKEDTGSEGVGAGARAASSAAASTSSSTGFEGKPTQTDGRRWTRGGKFARAAPGGAATPVDAAAAAEDAAAAAAAYESLKADSQAWTAALGAAGAVAAASLHGPPSGLSFLAGAAGGALYLRLLHRSVDGVAGGGGVGAAVGGQRLLIPLVLVLAANRFNFFHPLGPDAVADLPALLVGFFTYKAALAGRQAASLLRGLADAAAEGGNTPMGPG